MGPSVRSGKDPQESRVEATHIVLPGDTNALDTLFGGKLVQWIDVAAAVAARRHCGTVAVTASVDSLHFVHPVHVGDIVVVHASVNRAWKTSMEIGVRAECESARATERCHAATAYLTFVAIGSDRRPRAVPPIIPQTEVDQRRFDQAERRRQMRLKLRRDQQGSA